jgi:hypothetical protein
LRLLVKVLGLLVVHGLVFLALPLGHLLFGLLLALNLFPVLYEAMFGPFCQNTSSLAPLSCGIVQPARLSAFVAAEKRDFAPGQRPPNG